MLCLINHTITSGNAYDSILISSLCVYAINTNDHTFMDAATATQVYAAILAIYRSIILYHFYNPDDNSNYLCLVKDSCMKYMSALNPTPIGWIIKLMCYGKTITNESVSSNRAYWVDDTLRYQLVILPMIELKNHVRMNLEKASSYSLELTLCDSYHELPSIQLDNIIDLVSNKSIGYSFLTEPQNLWIHSGKNFIQK